MNERINEHDMTKRMMDVMRGGYKGLLTELRNTPSLDTGFDPNADQNNGPAPAIDSSQPQVSNDTIELKQGDAVFNDELNQMRDIVDGTVEFTSFNIYPTDKNVVIDGYMQKQESEDSGIFFKMAVTSSDIQTSMVDVELDDNVNEALQRLKGYYEKFKKDWGARIYKEYKPDSTQQDKQQGSSNGFSLNN